VQLFNDDCLKILPTIPDNSIDLINEMLRMSKISFYNTQIVTGMQRSNI
jgi:hypothetical protein